MTLCSQPPLPGAPTSIHPARGTVACFEHLIGICLGNLSPALFIFETVCLRLTLNFTPHSWDSRCATTPSPILCD